MIIKHFNLENGNEYHDEFIRLSIDNCIILKSQFSKVFGLGERYNSINHIGKTIDNTVEEKFCNQGEKTYFPLPFFMLDNGYGIFIKTKARVKFNFNEIIKVSNDYSEKDEIYILQGSYKEMIKDFLEITGKIKKAPKWIFGPWISAHRWNSQEIVDDVRSKLKNYRIPVTAMVLEQWSDEATFYIFNGARYPDKEFLEYDDFDYNDSPWPNPKEMVEQLHDDGIRLLLWQCPVVKDIPDDEPFNARHEKEWNMVRNEKLVVQSNDEAYTIPDGNWFNGSMIPDYSNAETINWWFKNRQYLLDIGVDGFKTDGGEFIHSRVSNHMAETEIELKNNYSLEYAKAYSDFLGDKGVAFSRAGYTGQQSYSLQWAGDQKSTFEELNAVYRAGINASLCGQINWGFDIAGFSGELPSLELYYRSNQFAVFTPIMQVHSEPVGGQFSAIDPIREFNNERTIWNIADGDEGILNDIRQLYNLRMNLLPYIYSEYLKAVEENSTLMKHMNIEFTGDFPESQYMFGQLIVVPILQKDLREVEISLPEGKFYNIFSEKIVSGKFLYDNLSINDMCVFIKDGKALVTKESQLIINDINNVINYEQLHFKLFGENGSYHFVDDNNDFIISWKNQDVTLKGKVTLEVEWRII